MGCGRPAGTGRRLPTVLRIVGMPDLDRGHSTWRWKGISGGVAGQVRATGFSACCQARHHQHEQETVRFQAESRDTKVACVTDTFMPAGPLLVTTFASS